MKEVMPCCPLGYVTGDFHFSYQESLLSTC